MALSDPTQIRTSDLNTQTTSYTAGEEPWNKNLDGYTFSTLGTESVTYQCDWDKWHGIYRKIPELRSTIDTECKWIIGKELIMDKNTQSITKRINGKGKETFRKILLNIKRVSKICGDAYAWAPRDKANRLINLKILDSGSIEIQANKFGIIEKYVQLADKGQASIIGKPKRILETFDPDEIFHISNESICDEIHGIPEPEKMLDIIKMRHQAMSDNTLILHRYGKPTFFYEANTDDETELESIKDTIDQAIKNFENVIVPKDTLTKIEKVSSTQAGTLDPMPWLSFLRSYFTESSGVPDLMRGKSDEVSLAAGKLNVVAYKEKIIFEQIEFSEEIEKQLGLKIKFERPIEIDIEIARTKEDMDLKTKAKREKGGNQIVSTNKMT